MNEPSTAEWGPCPPGELSRLAFRMALRKALTAAAAVAVAATLVTVVGWSAFGRSRGEPVPTKKSSRKGEVLLPPPGRGGNVSDQ